MPITPFKDTLLDALVKVFAAGCDLDKCISSPDFDPSTPALHSIEVVAEKLDEAQDLLAHLAGVSIDDVRAAYLADLSPSHESPATSRGR